MSDRPVRALQRFVLRTARTPLGAIWSLLYRCLQRAITAFLRRGHPDWSVYVTGSFAEQAPLYGVSDLDLIVVTPTDPAAPGAGRSAVLARRRKLRRLPLPAGAIQVATEEQGQLERAATYLTAFAYGLDQPLGTEPALYHGPSDVWRLGGHGILHRPDPAGPAASWRLLAGPERRPPVRPPVPEQRPPVAWLAIQSWWRRAFDACLDPERPYVPSLCVKLIAEPIRLLLWLHSGRLVRGRAAPLLEGRTTLPRYEEAIDRALDLHQAPTRSGRSSLAEFLPAFVQLSAEVARIVNSQAFRNGAQTVQLRGSVDELILPPNERPGARLVPLCDWHSLCHWSRPDEALAIAPGDPTDPTQISRSAAQRRPDTQPALLADELIIEPTPDSTRLATLRAAQCRASDPVSFGLLSGRQSASFPLVQGWSILDSARRATAEHRVWLTHSERMRTDESHPGPSLGKLLGAARAALLLSSVLDGEPELPLTASASAVALGDAWTDAAGIAEEAVAQYRRWKLDGEDPDPGLATALRSHVSSLPGYARPATALTATPSALTPAPDRNGHRVGTALVQEPTR